MSEDVTVDLVRTLNGAIGEASPDGEAWAMVLEFGDGYRSAGGYSYPADGSVTPVSCSWQTIQSAVQAYLGSHYEPGDQLPVKILVQFERTSGRYGVTFEDTDEERWKTRPTNCLQMREELRPSFD